LDESTALSTADVLLVAPKSPDAPKENDAGVGVGAGVLVGVGARVGVLVGVEAGVGVLVGVEAGVGVLVGVEGGVGVIGDVGGGVAVGGGEPGPLTEISSATSAKACPGVSFPICAVATGAVPRLAMDVE
jgi:hypothetical protein